MERENIRAADGLTPSSALSGPSASSSGASEGLCLLTPGEFPAPATSTALSCPLHVCPSPAFPTDGPQLCLPDLELLGPK